ncbi:MAG: aminotransferase class V-fold PLP-dependent enzyme [Anaerolineales bacterium]|nr:aminotransferase class V-fold PLP-dependent enzyme [Anaerolineales bacterium]
MKTPDFAAVRAEFPRANDKLWLGAAETHPFSIHHLEAIQRYSEFRAYGPGDNRHSYTPEMQAETKARFAALINAQPDEIAFVQSTTDGENIVLAGLGLPAAGGNIVIDDLHFEASKYLYTRLADSGQIELRVVPHRDWQIDMADVEAAIDDNTSLVSLALVSQVNGYKADIKRISDIAHAHGAYLYTDIIQGVGATPIDVEAMGIDFCATSTYKWLMGDFGIGFLYVKKELQGEVLKQTRYGLRQIKSMADYTFEVHPDASRYEGTSSMPFLPGICVYEGLKIIERLGVDNIVAHAQPLVERLQESMPMLGYQPITPIDNPTAIVSFLVDDVPATKAKLDKAFGDQVLSFRQWYLTDDNGERQRVDGIRFGISVYNNHDDIDRLLNALDS